MNAKQLLRGSSIPGLALSALALVLVAACGGSGNTANATTSGSKDVGGVTINYKVVGSDDGDVGPDGKKHDTFKTSDPTAVQLGQRVTLKFTNTDEMPHSYTLLDLGINVNVPGAKDGKDGSATYSFTANKAGSFRWFCAIPCDEDNGGWAMKTTPKGNGQDNFMAGYLTVK